MNTISFPNHRVKARLIVLSDLWVYKRNQQPIPPSVFDAIFEVYKEQISWTEEHNIDVHIEYDEDNIQFCFKNASDAVLFKVKWC